MPVFCAWCLTPFNTKPKPHCNNPEFHIEENKNA